LAFVEHAVNLVRDREVDAETHSELVRAARRLHTFRNVTERSQHGLELLSATELEADGSIARKRGATREHQIAEPREAGQRERLAALGHGEPRHLRETPRDERGTRVVSEAEPVGRA